MTAIVGALIDTAVTITVIVIIAEAVRVTIESLRSRNRWY
jgi:hypothetical protein